MKNSEKRKIKILWVVNTIFPDLAKNLGLPPPVFGGWMYGLASDLAGSNSVELAIATLHNKNETVSLSVNNIRYYLLSSKKCLNHKSGRLSEWHRIVSEFAPDLVHIHGTEYGYGMSLMNDFPRLNYLVSIQGLVSVYKRYYISGMSMWDILSNITLRDILRFDTIYNARHEMHRRGLVEEEYIRRAKGVIGRTEWDRACAHAINPNLNYHFCNETLRDEFYTDEYWKLDKCRKHSIFLSQASYPIKGLHQVIKAMTIIKLEYPDICLEIAGPNIAESKNFISRIKRTGYGKYIRRLINKGELNENVKFLGNLNAQEMKEAYLRANVFICPSSIENSPNSICEAQMLGVPVISSFVGGVSTILEDCISPELYEFGSHEVLALKIKKIFNKMIHDDLQLDREVALKRHDKIINKTTLINIYYCCVPH